ncbi:hypothetical protein [Natrinema hispanicum]|nr:hypothetical protein [Natrinema hispanicum]
MGGNDQEEGQQSDQQPVSTDIEDRREPQKASIEIVETDFLLGDSVTAPPDGQIPWITAEVENTTSVAHGWVRTEIRLYDSDDTILESREGYVDYIPANTLWKDYIRYYTETPDRLNRIETRIVDSDPTVDGRVIEDATVISSDMTVDPEGGVDLAVEVDLNGIEPNAVTVIGLFYDDQGRFRGTVSDVDTNPSETVAVSAGTISIRTPPNLETQQVTSHDVVVLDGGV